MKTQVVTINIAVLLESVSTIAAAISPIFDDNDRINLTAWNDYEEFITNLIGVFSQNGYELIRETRENYKPTPKMDKIDRNSDLAARPSPYSESYYFRIYKKSDSSPDNIKCLIIVRVSAHKSEEELESDPMKRARVHKKHNAWLENEAQRLKRPETKSRQKWRFKQMLVDGEMFDSYDDALDTIEHNIQSWR